ncbi:MAG: lysine--tRNA ligase [Acidobacteriota bacterium]
MTYWADDIAAGLEPSAGGEVLATGISPSGEIHVGNLREVLTGDAIHRVLKERGRKSKLLFIADDLDPLRRVYPFLPADTFAGRVGCSLSHIPCPCTRHGSYAEHFLEPFLASMTELEVDIELVRSHDLYASGRMDDVIATALEHTADIASILKDLTGKEVGPDWSVFDARCTACHRLTATTVTGVDSGACTVAFSCACGTTGTVPFAGGGKLTWRVDWPARWKVLGVTLEPFGKDHASRGGSYDTGVRIAREIFGIIPPRGVPYEWISLKGKGDMSSSRGNTVSIHRMLEIVPADLLRYVVLRTDPPRAIRFDPGLPLLQTFEEFENAENRNHNRRAAELSRVAACGRPGVSFRHLVTIAQVAGFDLERTREILARGGRTIEDEAALARRLEHVRNWLKSFAPPDVRFSLSPTLPEDTAGLTGDQRAFLARLAEQIPDQATGDDLHALIYELIEKRPDLQPAAAFAAIYLAFIGRSRGPRAGHFLAALPVSFVRERLRAASAVPGQSAQST